MDETLNRISELLEQSGMKKIEFLTRLGLSRSAWSAWTSGNARSYLKYLPQIAEIFGVSLDWLAGTEQKEKPAATSGELDPKSREIIDKLKMLNPGNRSAALALIDSLIKNQDKK